jgi:lipopolysaccharide export system protein LptC
MASVAEASHSPPDALTRWREHSRLIRRLRIVFPALAAVILLVMLGFIVQTTLAGRKAQVADADTPIQLVNPRFVGRDDKGRAFVLTAKSAVRDPADYQKVMLDTPMLILDEEGAHPTRISAQSGIYREDRRVLNLKGGVKLNGGDLNFETATSVFNTATGELEGQGQISGGGSLGEIIAKSYGVYDKGDRLVFKGGVRTRLNAN